MSYATVVGVWIGPLDTEPSSYIVKIGTEVGSKVHRVSKEDIIKQCIA